MIYFYEELVAMVEKIIEAKSTSDDIKAFNDIGDINYMLNIAQPTVEFIYNAKQLNEKINRDYPEINQMHQVAMNMVSFVPGSRGNSISEYDAILKDLRSDKFGIYIAVLLKHKKISCIKDFIRCVD